MGNGPRATAVVHITVVQPSVRRTGRERISASTRHRRASIRQKWPITPTTVVAVITLVVEEVATKTIAIETRHDEMVAEVAKRRVETIDEDVKHFSRLIVQFRVNICN